MSAEKTSLHPRNKHRERYDFPILSLACPELQGHVYLNSYDDLSVDFSNPEAVRALNKALLTHFYGIAHWNIPVNYLCPPIPGRADYIHYLADLLGSSNGGIPPKGGSINGLDIGIGANCIYPIIGHQEYGWTFLGSDIDPTAIKTARAIVAANPELSRSVTCRQQHNRQHIFNGILKPGELYDFCMCNPPFHSSAEEATEGTKRKLRNLGKDKNNKAILNFGGKDTELWYQGGETAFIRNMIMESKDFSHQCLWFTTLVSKSQNLPFIHAMFNAVKPLQVKTIEMAQGQKISRFVAWTFFDTKDQQDWAKKRWVR